MKKEFLDYFRSIGITAEVLLERIEEVYEFCSLICPDEIVDVFVDDYIEKDGTRKYVHLSFFSDSYSIGARNFLTDDDIIMVPIRKKVSYYIIKKEDYDFERATEKSRLHMTFILDIGTDGEFKASKENCDYLKLIFLKHIKSNLKE